MSRVGFSPITLPKGVTVNISGNTVVVKGPKGELKRSFNEQVAIKQENGVINVTRANDERESRALHGLSRALLNNMVTGVSTGFNKVIEITAESVGYRAEGQGKEITLFLGFSHPVPFKAPEGISFGNDQKNRLITISGIDKELVGETAARMRKLRPPEPYKGKGLKYQGEVIRRKAGKAGKTAKK
jgi:large subunit ribosomal protein L6